MKIYNAEKTAHDFHNSDCFVRGIMGPIGSGKSVACCMEILQRATRQRPNKDGIRKSRWAIVRNTYGELKSTTIKTWEQWIDPEYCRIVYDSPIRGRLEFNQNDGTKVDLELFFIALDSPKDARKLLSLELTGAWVNEAREVPLSIIDAITSRLDRYPSKVDGGASWTGLIMDTNPPDEDHWWYKYAEEETPSNWKFFKQPPALVKHPTEGYMPNPKAENIVNHNNGYGYYLKMLGGKSEEWIKVYVLGQYGSIMEGKAVYPEYNDDLHCSKYELKPFSNLPIVCGFDFGLTPACAFCQVTPRGALRVLDELVSQDMGIRQFMRDIFMPRVREKYNEWHEQGNILIIGDPAGAQRAQADAEITCFEEIRSFGFEAEPAESNAFLTRREAVATYMLRMSDGNPSFQLSPTCKQLRKGFLGGYHYARLNVIGQEKFKDSPEKNMFSHVQDALQYAALKAERGDVNKGYWNTKKSSATFENRSAFSM